MFHMFHIHVASACFKYFIYFQTYVVFKYFYVISILCCLSRGQLDWACGARAGGQWCCGRGGVCTLGVHKGNDPSGIPTMLLLTRSRLRLCLEPSSHGHHAADKMPPRPHRTETQTSTSRDESGPSIASPLRRSPPLNTTRQTLSIPLQTSVLLPSISWKHKGTGRKG